LPSNFLELAARGDLAAVLRAKAEAVPRATTAEVRSTARLVQRDVQREVFRKLRVKKPSFRNVVAVRMFPRKGFGDDPRAVVFSRAHLKRPGGPVDLLTVFQDGVQIAGNLIFPYPGVDRKTLEAAIRSKKLFRKKGTNLVFHESLPDQPLGIVSTGVRIADRLDLVTPYRRRVAGIGDRVAVRIGRDADRLGRRLGGGRF